MTNLPVPNPRTAIAGEFETAAFMNAFRDAINFLANPPRAVLTQSTVQSTTSGTAAAITFDNAVIDTYGGHSNSTNNSRYTAQVAGGYEVSAIVVWAANSNGNRLAQLYVNGVAIDRTFNDGFTATSFNAGASYTSGYVFLNAGDYVEVWGTQVAGAGLNTFASSMARSVMNVVWKSAT